MRGPQPWRDGYLVRGGTQDYHWEWEYTDGVPPPEAISAMLAKLSPRQRWYAVLRLRGAAKREAAREIGGDTTTVLSWERTPWWPALLEHYAQNFLFQKATILNPLVPLATKAVVENLRGNNGPEQQLDAAKFVLEQMFGKPGAGASVTIHQKSDAAETIQSVADLVRAIDTERRGIQESTAIVEVRDVAVDA